MGLGTLFQRSLITLAMANKEKLLAFFIEKLNDEYYNNRNAIAKQVLHYLPNDWKATASEAEMARLMDLIKTFIEGVYGVIQDMQQPELIGPPVPPRNSRL